MSKNKNIRLNDEVIDENELIQTNTDYKRDSFNDRVCDDLSEVLLSYLSFEDKFGFECISKQWKSLVFNKENFFSIIFESNEFLLPKGKLNSILFEDILRKFKRIDNIYIKIQVDISDKTLILQLITKHCNGLKSIRYDFSGIDMKTIESFGHKFGKSLQVLENSKIESKPQIETLLKFCNKLVSIKGIYFKDIFNINGELLLITDKIVKFGIQVGFDCVKQFETFIDKYKQTVKLLSIGFYRKESMHQFLIQSSKFINLYELQLDFIDINFNYITHSLDNGLALISVNCKNLEKLSFTGNMDSPNLPFKLIENFSQLKYLSIDANLFTDENGEPLSVKSFKNLKNLIHLAVSYVERGDDFFVGIHEYLPEIRVLKVSDDFDYGEDLLTELTFNHLSRTRSIETLEINKDFIFKVKAFENFINKNFNLIKSVKLVCNKPKHKDSHKQYFKNWVIDRLISLAARSPQIEYKFDLSISYNIYLYQWEILNKPNNIHINYIY